MKKYNLDGEIASFDFHDETGFWSFCGPKPLKEFLDGLSAGEKAEIVINSPGGSVISGVEMCNMIKNSNAHLIAHVTGIAASMASVIACACKEIVMEEASFMMIHDPWTECAGNAEELRKNAEVLDQMKAVIMSFYRGKFSKSEEELSALMSRETYMTANECAENGLACTVVKSDVRFAAKLTARSMANAPEAVAAFVKTAEMPADVKAAIEAAKAAADAAVEKSKSSEVEKPNGEGSTNLSTVQPSNLSTSHDWEARYKGASKKINELQAKLDAANAANATAAEGAASAAKDLAAARDEIAALKKQVEDFNNQVKASGYEDLAALTGAVSALKADLEKSGKDLADTRQQLDHLKSTRDLLTGGVLTPADNADSYEAKMADPNKLTVNERENLRAKKRAGKIK